MDIITRKQAIEQGLTHYFTGKPCKRGHISERLIVGTCVICHSEYYSNKKEKLLQYQNDRYRSNKEKCLQYQKEYYALNKNYYKQYRDEYFRNNPEKFKKYNKDYYINNKEKCLQYSKNYRLKNPEKVKEIRSFRRASKLQRTPGWLTNEDRKHIKWLYAFAAHLTKLKGVPYHVDHIIPLLGKNVSGLHIPSNLRVIPGIENIKKSNNFEV